MELIFASSIRTNVVFNANMCYNKFSNRVSGWLDLNQWIGGDAMKNFSFQDLMAFGMFIIALLTFIRLMCL